MAARLTAILLLALGLLPIPAWLPGGEQDPLYAARMLDWAYGLALCAGVGVLAWYVMRRREGDEGSARNETAERLASAPRNEAASSAREAWAMTAIALGAGVLYAIIAQVVFTGRPLLIDEIVQVLQARWYAEGRLAVPTAEPREFFSILHLVDLGPRTFSQFPAGGPAMLALGALFGAEWLVGPVAGAVAVYFFGRLLRMIEPTRSPRWRVAATALFALAPFGAFMFGSHMNHATTLMWLLVAAFALARLAGDAAVSPRWGMLVGFALGAAATIRPVDGAAFAIPAGAWLLWRARRGGGALAALLLSGVGIAIPLVGLLLVNASTTGDPFLFGYDLLWGSGHSLGFHQSPWGPLHTPARGLELLSLYIARLGEYLLETPFPAFLPAAVALWLTPRLAAFDRYLLVSSGLLLTGYWAYWHDGYYLGPRFLLPLLPLFVLWTARLPVALLGTRAWSAAAVRGFLATGVATFAYAIIVVLLVRAPQYRNGMTSMRLPIESSSRAAGVRDALVLVQESWGARLVVRMWALGVGRSDTEVLYRTADACKLELTITALEREGVRGIAARDRLAELQTDSAALVASTRSPDFTERMLPGSTYAPACESAIAMDAEGFSHLAPLRLARDGNVYARWLPGREAEIAALYPDRPVYLLGRAGTDVEAPLRWTRWSP